MIAIRIAAVAGAAHLALDGAVATVREHGPPAQGAPSSRAAVPR